MHRFTVGSIKVAMVERCGTMLKLKGSIKAGESGHCVFNGTVLTASFGPSCVATLTLVRSNDMYVGQSLAGSFATV